MKNWSLLLVLASFQAFAQTPASSPTATPAASASIADICKEIQTTRDSTPRQSRWRILWDIVKMELFPGKLVHLDSIEIPVDSVKRVRAAPESTTPIKTADDHEFSENIIFSLTPPEEVLGSSDLSAMETRYADITVELKQLARQAASIIAAPTVEACIQQTQDSGLKFNGFMKLAAEKNSLQVLEQIKDSKIAARVIDRAIRRSRLDWQVIQSTDLMTLHRALIDKRVKNVVILSHGSSEGKLVDSRLTEYPLGFFAGISPSIYSISIFACHGEAIVKEYKIKEYLSSTASEYSTRKVYVSDGSVIAGMPELVPIRAFRAFMIKLDRQLAFDDANEGDPQGPLQNPAPLCKVVVKGMTVIDGTLGFSLNGAFIGSANPGTRDPEFVYPCEWRNRKQNVIVIHGYQVLGLANVQLADFTITVDDPVRPALQPNLMNFFRADQSYQGSTFTFE